MKKIAFLFLIYDSIKNEEAWNLFFKGVDHQRYTIKIHYKTNKPLKYFEKYKLQNCIYTNYVTDTTIARAHTILIKEALKDPDVYKTINLSQSCIPFKSFDHIYNFLTRDNLTHLNTMPMTEWSVSVTSPAVEYIAARDIFKASNWFILNRDHAKCCLSHPEYFKFFEGVHSPEEFMFITMFKKHLPSNIVYHDYSPPENSTTFTNWDYNWGMVYKFPNDNSIKTYLIISREELDYLLSSPCLFGRKFEGDCSVDSKLLIEDEAYRNTIYSPPF